MAANRELWQIERSFRIAKSDQAARPNYHRLENLRLFEHLPMLPWVEGAQGIRTFVD
jgi:hypothetical protein